MRSVQGNVTRFERLGPDEGLSQGCVNCILQDSQGFLWAGTQDGLNRYDGYTFTVYHHDPTDPTSLDASVINAQLEDSQGGLWLGTVRGLVRFDRRSEVFTPYPLGQKDRPPLAPVWIRALLEDSQGMLWVGTLGQGLHRLDRRTGRWTAYQHDPEDQQSLPSDKVVALLEDTHGTLWVGTHGGGLGRLDRKNGGFAHYRHRRDDPHSLGGNNINALCEDAQGNLWIGTQTAGLSVLDLADRGTQFVRYQNEDGNPHSLSNNHVFALLEDTAGTLWVGTGGGLNELDRQTGRFRRHYAQDSDPSSLSHNDVLSLAEDAQGLLWIGTRIGLNKFDRKTRAFGHFRRRPEKPGALSSNVVLAFLQDVQGFLWIGTYGGGLNRSTTNNRLAGFAHISHREGDPHSLADWQALPDMERPGRLGDNAVFALCEDARRQVWIGTDTGLYRLVPGDHQGLPPTLVRYQYEADNPSSLSDNTVIALALDAQGDLWIATLGGLNKLIGADATQGFVRYPHDEKDPHSLSHDRIRTIHTDSAGNVWIGTNAGLNTVAPEGGAKFVRYQHDDTDPHSLSHDWVNCIAEDGQGFLWLGTWGGLNRFDPRTGRCTAYRVKDGLSNDMVYGLLVDDQGSLWLSTNRGINHFDPVTERFTHYDAYDGVQNDEFAQGAFYKDRQGRLYFGGPSGFNVFRPEDIRENTYLPPVVLTSFLLSNQPVPISESGPLKASISFADQVELAPDDHVFAFEFSALNYRQPHKNRFAYRLEGFDPDWIYTGARDRKAVYTNVPPGNYTFRVKAANDDGLWNEAGTSIRVTVSQPWWHIVFRSAFEAVVVHDQGTILETNQAALELFGYERSELIGRSVHTLIAPDGREQVAERVATGDETPYEATSVRKDGSVFVGEVRGRMIPYQGRRVRVAAVRDITERKRAEAQLQEMHDELERRVQARTAALNDAVERLRREVDQRQRAEADTRERVAVRTRELSTFFDLTTLAIGTQELPKMLEPIPDRILELGSCDAMCIHLLDAERTTLTLAAQGNLSLGMRQRVLAIAVESDFLQRVVQLGEPVTSTDGISEKPLPDQLRLNGFPTYLGVPLPGGWVSYYRASAQGFSLDESALLLALAEQVGVSVENHRLRRRIGELAVLEERQRLARDLHDSVAQSLYLLALYAGGGRDAARDGDLGRVIDLLSDLERDALHTLREMRLLLYELQPAAIEQDGLVRTLERRFDVVERRAGMTATVVHEAEGDVQLPPTLERELYYLVMEALNNTLKHADATTLTVRIQVRDSELRLEIVDNGCGFEPEKVSRGLGLKDMRERVERFGGRLEIASKPGTGTRIVVWLPLDVS